MCCIFHSYLIIRNFAAANGCKRVVFRPCTKLYIINYRVMKTKVNEVSRKTRGSRKSQSVNVAAGVAGVVSSAVASAVAGSATSHETAVAVASGAAAPASVPAGRASDVAGVMDVNEIKVIELRQKISAHFAAPEWSGAAAVRAALAAAGVEMSSEMIEAAVAAAARKSGVDLSPLPCSVARVLAVIRSYYKKEFESVCGCSFETIRAYYRENGGRAVSFSSLLPASLVSADSLEQDFIGCSAVPAGASASAVAASVLSFRAVASFRAALAAAVASARSNYFAALAAAFRAGAKLGYSVKEMQLHIEETSVSVSASDRSDEKRLTRSLSRSLVSLAALDARIMVLCPAVADIDTSGAFFIPASASLPASAPAKVRKMWAKRARLLSAAATLRALLGRC